MIVGTHRQLRVHRIHSGRSELVCAEILRQLALARFERTNARRQLAAALMGDRLLRLIIGNRRSQQRYVFRNQLLCTAV